jgi:hypothetical protein
MQVTLRLATAVSLKESPDERRREMQGAVPQEDREGEGDPEGVAHELLFVRRASQRGGDQQERRQEREQVDANESDHE